MSQQDVTLEPADLPDGILPKGDYDNCTVRGCDLSEADLSQSRFTGCIFEGCNLSMARLTQTALREVYFKDCKLLGVRFDACRALSFEVGFEHCTLHLSSFYGCKLVGTTFKHCILHETDFTEADLTQSVLEHCDLSGAVFDQTNLEQADFRTASGYAIDPTKNRIKKARFAMPHALGLLHGFGVEVEC